MAKYRISVALLCGAGFASFLPLLLKVSPAAVVSIVVILFLTPGGVLATLLLRSQESLAILAANALVYSAVALAMVLVCCRNVTAATMRLATIRLVVPVTLLVCLACIPAFNPLWPRGMTELTKQEKELQEAFPLGMGLNQAQAVCRSKGIPSEEQTETSEIVVLQREEMRITAVPGDRVIYARLKTGASQFPCGYEIEVILLFGQDEKLKQQYIHRFPLCL